MELALNSDEAIEADASPLEQLKARHRKEKKELLAKITSLKHSVAKNDKKRRKEIGVEIERLEKNLKDRHEKELREAEAAVLPVGDVSEGTGDKVLNSDIVKQPRISKAVKRREKKAEMQRRMNEASARDAEASKFAPGKLEMDAINNALSSRNLQLYEIPPNGDCLYNAVAHQMSSLSEVTKITGKDARRKAASYIRAHEEDFLPFLTWEDGSPIDAIEFEKYCFQVESTSEDGGQWGGEPELRALSNVFERKIEVLQPEGRVAVFGEQYSGKKPLVITYHRHAYSLGEHYNSTVAVSQA